MGIGEFQHLSATELRGITEPTIVTCFGNPVSVLLPYDLYMKISELYRILQEGTCSE
jgi:ATP-dependent phosphoenolpyruvate carboxykinase